MRRMLILTAILALLLLPLSAQTVTLTSPNGGENWTIGSTASITWNVSGVATVRLILHKGGTGAANRLGIIAQGLNAASGSYTWTVGSYDTGTAVAGNDYYIRLKAEGADVEDFNNTVFAISAPLPHFTLFSPNGGESWEKGSDRSISWEAVNMPVNFRLLLLKDNQVLGIIRDNLSPGNGAGAIPWKAGDYIGGSASVFGGGYKVRIESVNGLYRDNSDNAFTITAPPLAIQQPLEKRPDLSRLAYLKPDLVVCLRWDGGNPLIYQDKRIKVWVKNVGPVAAPASTLEIYIEGKGTHLYAVPALAPSGQFYWTAKYDWPTCGHKTVRATADIHGVVNELNEENNVLEGRVEVNCGFSYYSLEMLACSDGTKAPE